MRMIQSNGQVISKLNISKTSLATLDVKGYGF